MGLISGKMASVKLIILSCGQQDTSRGVILLGVFFDVGAEGCFMEGPALAMISATAAELDMRHWCQKGVSPGFIWWESPTLFFLGIKRACAEEVVDSPPYKTLESALEEVSWDSEGPREGAGSLPGDTGTFLKESVELSPKGAARAFRPTNGERSPAPHVWAWNSICLGSILPCHLLRF